MAVTAAETQPPIPRFAAAFVTQHSCELSGPALVGLEWIENTVPAIDEVEVRQIKHQQWVVFFPAAPEYNAPVTPAR
jgi:hypothetical protein